MLSILHPFLHFPQIGAIIDMLCTMCCTVYHEVNLFILICNMIGDYLFKFQTMMVYFSIHVVLFNMSIFCLIHTKQTREMDLKLLLKNVDINSKDDDLHVTHFRRQRINGD